ncbi:MAG TPA: hypothetical protein PLV49_04305 [Methanothrix soehngenii]|nr:hypothetical protein [Methanothrix soehngenii]
MIIDPSESEVGTSANPCLKILNRSTCRSLTGIQCQQINLSRSERLGEQLSFMKSLHDAIDFSLSILSVDLCRLPQLYDAVFPTLAPASARLGSGIRHEINDRILLCRTSSPLSTVATPPYTIM